MYPRIVVSFALCRASGLTLKTDPLSAKDQQKEKRAEISEQYQIGEAQWGRVRYSQLNWLYMIDVSLSKKYTLQAKLCKAKGQMFQEISS